MQWGRGVWERRRGVVTIAAIGLVGYQVFAHPPVETLGGDEIGVRSNSVSGGVQQFHEGPLIVVPGLHHLRRYSLRDRVYRPLDAEEGAVAPFQSIEGLSFGIDLTVRCALDPAKIDVIARQLPENLDGEVVEPAVQGVIYRILARYTVKEIFATKRGEIHDAIEAELKPRLAADGILLRGVQIGKVELPPEYRAGMERLLAEELEAEKMNYTIAVREKTAQAAANEQIIAAKAQEEAMKHVLPFKQKQVEQRKLEADAEKQSRIRVAEGNAEARRIEAAGEADSRRKLADAESYRLENVGKVTSAQMERDGQLLSKHPLLIQKTMADKLSDKVQVIIAPPPASGGFIGSTLLGQGDRR
jgi:regulator of protease activity HflC (stomatin/prohibitin superfamily)